mmetsp:Transcript_42454/g.59486  ORF Transcript_42454/g.59486 Transcript_42454/m.59486 type:complete len:146 (+) Transcript_42454:656-1093(+)
MTAPLQEIPNRIEDEGAKYIAEMLEENDNLVYLDITHNHIGKEGISQIEKAILGEREKEERVEGREIGRREKCGLVKIRYDQAGLERDQTGIEKIKRCLREKRERWKREEGEEWRKRIAEHMYPRHLRAVASVYRVNGKYKEEQD